MADKPTIIQTHDGSHSVHSPLYNAAYHSHFGAIDESITIFLSAGLLYQKAHLSNHKKIHIFEMGFGTGLNALLTQITAEKFKLAIDYTAIELHPIEANVIAKLNYGSILKNPQVFQKLHALSWNANSDISSFFSLTKIHADIRDHQFTQKYDLIYYDAFAPSAQPELWEPNIHQQLYNALNPGGCLVTYCAKGIFKRMLQSLGYRIEALPGPGKKKEMTRAIKPTAN